MLDPRMTQLADTLVNFSCGVQEGEHILFEAIDIPEAFVCECIRMAQQRGAHPQVLLRSSRVHRALLLGGSEAQWRLTADVERQLMANVQCYVGIRGSQNVAELSDVPVEKTHHWESQIWQRVHHQVRVPHTRWVVLRWPGPNMAQLADMSTAAFEDFYFRVCTMDYAALSRAMVPLKARLEAADEVRIVGPGSTDVRFSIKDIPAVPCDGRLNIPDGEVFTAPVRDSVNGTVHFNAPSLYRGVTHEGVKLTFADGKIVQAESSNTPKLLEVFDTDDGARHLGEFAIGVNPHITRPMKDILFDEKIAGSVHLTPGNCYDVAPNGNRSAIHWDLVLIQRPEYGGGELYLDGQLVRRDGLFVVDDLKGLNPEALLG
ncbi:MAG: aminopeptidase [Candidatus Competibacterales bacterium]